MFNTSKNNNTTTRIIELIKYPVTYYFLIADSDWKFETTSRDGN